MAKITFIGAGSIVFTRNLCSDILLTPALQDSTISLMDIDPVRLDRRRAIWCRPSSTGAASRPASRPRLDRREAVQDADYVITTFQQGGLDAYALDIEIPRKYGVEQCVGDTLGPGGVFRGLRTIPVLLDLCDDMDELAPDALLLNYVNPMAINCWAVAEGYGPPARGPVPQRAGHQRDAGRAGSACPTTRSSSCAPGINHQAWFLEFRRGKEDLYPLHLGGHRAPGDLRPGAGAHRPDEVLRLLCHRIQRPRQRVRALLPQERQDGRTKSWCRASRTRPTSGSTLAAPAATCATASSRLSVSQSRSISELIDGIKDLPTQRTHEYGSYIIEAMETNRPGARQRQRAQLTA